MTGPGPRPRDTAKDGQIRGILDLVVFSGLTAFAVVLAAVVRIAEVFRPEGVAVRLPLADAPATLTIDGASAAAAYTATDATVLVPDAGAGTLAWFTASIGVAAVAALVVLGALIRLALAFQSGRLFTRTTVRALTLIGGVLFAGSCIVMLTDALGRSGAYATLGIPYEPIGMLELVPYLPAWIAAIAVAMLAGAFERGQRMQRDTEGLV